MNNQQKTKLTNTLRAISALGFSPKYLGIRTDKRQNGWKHHSWRVRIGKYSTKYRQGMAINQTPSVQDIVYTLASDTACVEGTSLREFMGNLGYEDKEQGRTAYLGCCESERVYYATCEAVGIDPAELYELLMMADAASHTVEMGD